MSLNTDYGNEKEREGILEELFIHEGSHASLDGYHANVIYCYSCLYAIFSFEFNYSLHNKMFSLNLKL